MKRWLRIALILLGVVVVLILASGFVLRSFVSGASKDRIAAMLGDRIGAPVSIGAARFDLKQWFLLRPAVALDDISVGNPPGFPGKNLLHAASISAQVSLLPLLHKDVQVQSIVIEQPDVVIENGPGGHTNLETVLKKVSSGSNGAPSSPSNGSAATLAIQTFSVTSGSLLYTGPRNFKVHDINISVSNFSNDRSCDLRLSAKLYGNASGLTVTGTAGPLSADSFPINGNLSFTIAPAEIPASLRREQFGNLLATPGARARAIIQGTVKGDLYGVLSGPAKLTLRDLMLGSQADHLLPISGNAPATFTAANIVSTPRLQLDVSSAKLELGSGQWNGSAAFSRNGELMKVASRGSIRNLDIDQLLSVFTTERGKIYGLLAVPTYSVEMSGHNADELRNGMKGTASLSVTKGRVTAMDLPATLQRVLSQNQPAEGTKGATAFDTLTAGLTMANAKVNVANLLLDGSTLRVTGDGVLGFDRSLDFKLLAHVSGSLARLVNAGPLPLPSITADVPLTVTGTVESPVVRPQIGKMAKSAAEGILHNLLKKKLGQ